MLQGVAALKDRDVLAERGFLGETISWTGPVPIDVSGCESTLDTFYAFPCASISHSPLLINMVGFFL